jgi:hypothetical protein
MNGREHPRPTGARRPGRRLALFALALALAGCGGGTDIAVLTGSPTVDTPAPPATAGPGASGSGATGSGATGSGAAASGGSGPAATTPPDATTPPTSPGDAPVDIEVGGPSLNIPANTPLAPLQSFGEVAVGADSAPRRFRLRSGAGDAVEVLALTVRGDGSFFPIEDQCTGATLAAGGSGGCVFAVVFRPRQEGAATGELLVRVATGTRAMRAAGRLALARERTVARVAGHGTTAGL